MRLIIAGFGLALTLATATSATSAEPGGVRGWMARELDLR
jgi:hypothetical protein